MKKIAVLRCLITSASCAGTGCLKAFNEKESSFCIYENEPVRLEAFWTCNGCGNSMLENQEGLERKIERMKENGISAVHISACTKKADDTGAKVRCPTIADIAEKLRAQGIEIVEGTHEKTIGKGEGQELPHILAPTA